ncbi:CP2 transcription factor, partial [Syncephalis pseudoplumigaleata]
MRYTVVLDAPTAAAQRVEQGSLTYINKGQYYNLALTDTVKEDCLMETVIRIMFHEKAHRRLASTYWSHWLGQQASPNTARAIEINFDRVRVRWYGQKGATVQLRLNCLSTEFTRVKGVKGIPMRIYTETRVVYEDADGNAIAVSPGMAEASPERAFAAVKLFRDKGAERKNKDDMRHREKLMLRMRGK